MTTPGIRVRIAQGLAFVALCAAAVGSLGSADRVQTTYTWPPRTLPAGTPDRTWYTPLLLIRHSPAAISATVPCALAQPLSMTEDPVTVLATARYPERIRGLAIRRTDDRLEFKVGDRLLAEVRPSGGARDGGACSYRLRMEGERWELERQGNLVRAGTFRRLPVVTGLFSSLDLRAKGAPSIDVTTAVHATRTTTQQKLTWTVAAIAAALALLLVSVGRHSRAPSVVARDLSRGARANARAPDAVVAVLLVGWWIASPANFDDGWIVAMESMFESSGGFSTYYGSLGVNMPVGYWMEWVHHWVAQSTPSLLLNRLPALACLAVIWVLCRWMTAHVLRPLTGDDGLPLWTLSSVFIAGAFAWGLTLRPEPITALSVTVLMTCMVLFLERGSTAAVAVAAAVVALAISAHPAGVVSLAAIVVASPRLLRWLRPNAAEATAIVAAAVALLTVLLFVGADFDQRRFDAGAARAFADNHEAWRDELFRYSLLNEHLYGTPLRRLSVALIALVVLAFVLRRRREPRTLLDFPAAAVTAGLVLLVATPSKWPSHFGTLLGVVAVAFCCEAARLRGEATRSDAWRPWPFVAVGASSGVVAWAWLEREQWNVLDLRTLAWTPGVESSLPVARLAALLPLVCLGLALVVARIRRRDGRHAIPWTVASWTGPLIAVPVLAFTIAMIVADTAETSSWTLARQNLGTLAGRDVGCGLADDLRVPVRSSARSLATVGTAEAQGVPTWVPSGPAARLQRYALGPTPRDTVATPWFALPEDRRFGMFVTGEAGTTTRLRIEWGRPARGETSPFANAELSVPTGPLAGDTPWRFLAAGDLPDAPAQATAVRVTQISDVPPEVALAVTAPVTYESEVLAQRMSRAGSRALVFPNLLTYLPCARLPLLSQGIVEVPTDVVSWRGRESPLGYPDTSPFRGVVDVYDLEHLSLMDSENAPTDVVAYEVDRRIPGAALAPPTALTYTS